MTFRRRRPAGSTIFVAAIVVAVALWLNSPAPSLASGETTMQSSILAWMNRDRVAHGLLPLRLDGRLAVLAGDRAATMASTGIMAHAAGGTQNLVTAEGIQWYTCGENVGMTTATWGTTAAAYMYDMWRNSPEHWALMMSPTFNYVGIGVAYKSVTGATFASILFTESADHTRPGARIMSGSVSGTTIAFTWRGWDPLLQTHTAGLRYFDVEYRVDAGAWRLIRDNTTTTALRISGRPHGHYYWIRVRSFDGRGNVSAYSTRRVWVP